jgi:glutamyl-tRNA reductase
MESMVVGETQITGQIKRAYETASQKAWVGHNLHRCFQRAFKVAKRVRSETEVGRLAVSIPSIGVKLAEKVLGNLSSKTVAVLGLGEIGRIAAEHFQSLSPQKMYLYNRTFSKAQEFANNLSGKNIEVEVVPGVGHILHEADIIISAVDAVLLDNAKLKKLEARGKPTFILDLAVPASVGKHRANNLYYFGIDDLKKISDENNKLRSQEVLKAYALIESEVEDCWKTLSASSLSETFEKLAHKAQGLAENELNLLKAKLPDISDEDWGEIEKMAKRISQKCIQDPMRELKQHVQSSKDSEGIVAFFRNIFRI